MGCCIAVRDVDEVGGGCPLKRQALAILKKAYGPETDFRAGQWDAISALVERRERALVVQRTGWGKSVVYFVATRLLRAQGRGPTVIVSPLLRLRVERPGPGTDRA